MYQALSTFWLNERKASMDNAHTQISAITIINILIFLTYKTSETHAHPLIGSV